MTKAPTAVICLSPYSGGMEIDSIKMAKKLAPYCKTILIANKDHFIANEVSKSSNEFESETVSFKSNLGPALIFGIRNLIKKHGIKNVIFFGASELKSLYFSFLGLDINLIIRHGTTKSRPKKDWFHRLIYSKVNYHVAICEHLAKNVRYIIPFGKETELKVIYSSIELKKEPEPREYQTPVRILNVGRIAKGKGQDDAIKACSILHKNGIDFKLTFVGDGEEQYVNEIRTLANSIPFKDNIIFAGRSNDIPSYLNENDIFLFPSAGEGLSNAFIEALSYGLVCLAYNNTSFPEFKEMGFHCHLVKNDSLFDLKNELFKITLDIKKEKNKSLQNISVSKEIFDVESEIRSYNSLLV